MIRYYITGRAILGGGTAELLDAIRSNDAAGVDYIQIREKDLTDGEVLELARQAVALCSRSRVLVNGRADIALAAGAAGVHLPSHSIAPDRLRTILPAGFLVGVSCHTLEEVALAQSADFLVFSPVFDSPGKGDPQGLAALAAAAAASGIPVLALGGVTAENARSCMEAGAAGVAGIRMFQPA